MGLKHPFLHLTCNCTKTMDEGNSENRIDLVYKLKGNEIVRKCPTEKNPVSSKTVNSEKKNTNNMMQGCRNMLIFLTPDVPSLILPNVILL